MIGFAKAEAALRGGAKVMVTHSDEAHGGVFWSINGQTLHPSARKKLACALAPEPDGLFGAESAQTLRWQGWPE